MSKINANVLLIKPTENYAKLSNDYGLSEVNVDLKVIKNKMNNFLINSSVHPPSRSK